MKNKIIEYLRQIESEKEIKILLACETGSRAWGFPSPDSDYDIRFIYKHELNWYLSLNDKKDTIERMYENNDFDLSGWDLKKSLNLLWKSNPPLLERIQSPIVYISDSAFLSEINDLAQSTYSKIATMHHYLSMSKKMYSEVKDNPTIKLKKLFYALRTSIACKWIIEREEIPPIVFQKMLEELDIEDSVRQKIYELIDLKSTKNEDYLHLKEIEINRFIEKCIQNAERAANSLPANKGKVEDLDSFFIKNLQ
ncbi:MAG: nucleotidyltransferase domain-containing protein [Flavobacterium sp.]|nr:nucleotidyltransferase domain-containing protein [Flavobacterium sp.]